MSESGERLRVEIRPEPTEAELAAIVAALQTAVLPALTQPPAPPGPQRPVDEEPSRWRFAGRWWSKPTPILRDRP